ncbi:hypothetical protein MTO96_014565 [Rhipicephalus appendiculatus]
MANKALDVGEGDDGGTVAAQKRSTKFGRQQRNRRSAFSSSQMQVLNETARKPSERFRTGSMGPVPEAPCHPRSQRSVESGRFPAMGGEIYRP